MIPRGIYVPLVASLLLAGCGVKWIPLPDGATIDPATRSAIQSRDGVTITVQASAWRGSPAALEAYVTPIAFHVLNGTTQVLRITSEDFALFDEAGRQSTPLPPERVAAMFWSGGEPVGGSTALTVESGVFRPIRHRPFIHNPFLFPDPFFWPPWWWEPWPPPGYGADIFLQALPLGRVYPGAQIRGFVYFARVDLTARRLTLRVDYSWEGTGSRTEMLFTFAAESVAGSPAGAARDNRAEASGRLDRQVPRPVRAPSSAQKN